MQFEPQVPERAESFKEHQSSLALKVSPNEENFDWIGVRHAWRGSAPILYVHAGGNDGYFVCRNSITLHKAELCPFRPRNKPASRPETVAVQAPSPALKPG